jgi:ATP-dependent RNA helicase RhlE
VDLSTIEVFVVDEADRMHDMGFIPQVRRILEALPEERQTMMFTATLPPDVERIARRHMRSPVRIQIGRRSAPAERAQQRLFKIHENDKAPLLLHLLKESDGRVLVFVRTKRGVDRLARIVENRRHRVARLHSDRAQSERDEAMSGFREGRYQIMIATDIAARGLDVADIEHVINYDFPLSAEDYVHRIGRTARVAATGRATSFVTPSDHRYVAELERLVGSKVPLEGAPVKADEPRQDASRGRRSSRRTSEAAQGRNQAPRR